MIKANSFLKKTIQLIIVAFISKGLGFLREIVLAYFYGTSYVTDAYVTMQNIPAIIFTVFGVAVTTGFIPIYTEVETKKGKSEARKFVSNVINIFLILSIILSILGILFSKELVYIFAGGFSSKAFNLCNEFTKIIMPSCIAIILVYVYNAYLQICGYFNQNFLMNVPYNLIQIIFIAIAFYLKMPLLLAIGCLLASISQYVYLKILISKKTNLTKEKYINLKDSSLKKMIILVGPVFISTGINQINSIIDRLLASGLIEGSVSALNYSGEVSNIVTQVIILSMTTILYPKMTKLFSQNENEKLSIFLEKYINIVSMLVLPLSIIIFILSKEIVSILFGRGAFTSKTILFVSKALKIYSIGIIGASFRDALNKIFYSIKDTITPTINGCLAVACNIILNIILVKKYKYLGLAFATAFSSIFCTLLMFIQLCKKLKNLDKKNIILEFFKCLLSSLIMLVSINLISDVLIIKIDLIKCIIYGIIGFVIYIACLYIFKESIISENIYNLKRKINNK